MKKLLVLVGLCFLGGMFVNAQELELEKGVRNAVNKLTERLQVRWDVSIEPMTMEGTDKKYPFSRQLYTLVLESATNNPRYFRVVDSSQIRNGPKQTIETNKGIIKGNFAVRRDKVEVFINLVSSPDGVSISAQRFSFPLAELPANALALENEEKSNSSDQIFKELADTSNMSTKPVNTSPTEPEDQVINIMAEFNSPSMTYFHRDELKITLLADKDCYFKVIHIDVENQMKMIYPNSTDKNNRLKANTPRAIYEKASYMLYEPYGAETILVITSPKQFLNIEKEYLVPWIPATAEEIRNAVKKGRGGELEDSDEPITFTGEGEIKYSISIIKPHEEYEFTKPTNMKDFVKTTREDAIKQGGSFEGNETSGVYIIGDVRGSYRVPRNKPDVIQFASYSLDVYTSDSPRGAGTRGAGFSFSFPKPKNISVAVETVRSKIIGKGGVFDGDEQQGYFRASGIIGQYQVNDLVNVTILDKPFIVPKSLIENEVKNFFGVK